VKITTKFTLRPTKPQCLLSFPYRDRRNALQRMRNVERWCSKASMAHREQQRTSREVWSLPRRFLGSFAPSFPNFHGSESEGLCSFPSFRGSFPYFRR
jgi:hypothetical protein